MAAILFPCAAITQKARHAYFIRERRCGAETTLVNDDDDEEPRCKAHGGQPRFKLEEVKPHG